ncbi:Short transient receptor putative channel 4 [Desmophyllum pertusum]|uniref:Short transient receptor putative channel 4 n=1 Tax=Desmophyllum pertusum TaxID=174260 RepID=A0A9X0CW61_9CNID|nr:Short transient receptor putative channel 4 [Desmophyllum pertusum]
MSRITKLAWFFLQLVFVAVSSIVYIPIRLARKFSCCNKDDNTWWEFRELYEHPYSKFINHTMWYLGFLSFILLTSFEHEFGTKAAGLVHIDFVVLSFVLGLLLQEFQEAQRQGFYVYMSKWWNVVDTLIIVTFLASYAVWLLSWFHYGKWKPRKAAFIVADVLYASATVIAYFHLTHIFQVDSVLGPLQLSLYKMLKDVRRFFVIFLLLYVSFVNGIVKVYSYYIASQIELRRRNITNYEESHSYANHADALIGLFWFLLGVVDDDKISVKDPAFVLTATFGRLFLMVYVICTVIVALNMLIAMMNNSFERIMENSDIEWKFSRARMWLEWIDNGNTVPAPINIIYIFYERAVRLCGNIFGFFKEKCRCCQGNKEEDEEQATKERRKDTMKDLVVKYLKDRYFGKSGSEYNRGNKTRENNDATSRRGTYPMNINDNINLMKRLVDHQTKELAELNKKIDSMVK